MKNINFLLLLLIFSNVCLAQQKVLVSGPGSRLICTILKEENQMFWTVDFNGRPVIRKSPMKMLVDSDEITKGIQLGKAEKYKIDESYPWYGLHSTATNKCNGVIIPVSSKKISYRLEIRVFDDAVAFRFIVPGNPNSQRYPDEATVFSLPSNSTAWYHDLNGHYEGIHVKNGLDTVPAGRWAAPPVTIKFADGAGYASITEANLENYAGMALQTNGNSGFTLRLGHSHPASYPYVLRYSKEDVERLSKIAPVTGTISTPWRVVMVGKDLNTLVNCDAVHNLCPAPDKNLFPQGIATSWIRPGRAVWKYLDGGGENTLENMKEFSRKAGELGFEHNILEGFWSKWTDDQIRELVTYSNQFQVGIWVWKHSKSLRDSAERHAFFQRCHDLGISGVKIDFFDHEAKEVIDLYDNILKETAALHLLVDFHGANKPTGLNRTWPNELTIEGIKGMESSKLTDRATHETTLPFTRFLAGPAEYTPVHFGDRRKNTTLAHQIATAAIFSAPLLTYAANPDNLLASPAMDMIKSIPSVWDETIVLPPSEIGEIAVFAQRKGNTWFLSVINGLQPKSVNIPLTFLTGKFYKALEVKDAENQELLVRKTGFKNTDNVQLNLGTGGGYIARFDIQ